MDSQCLSPRHLLAHLKPELSLDDELLPGWRLSDCFRIAVGEPLRVELRSDHGSLGLSLEPTPEPRRHRAMASAAGLDIGYRNQAGVDKELAEAACIALAERLTACLGEAPLRWRFAEPSLRELVEPVAAELHAEPASLVDDPDRVLLGRDFEAYARLYGVRPEALRVRVLDRPCPGVSVFYPVARNGKLPNSASVYPSSLRIAHRRRMRRYFAGLGMLFDEQAVIRTVPTPTTYERALVPRRDRARIQPRMVAGISAALRPVHWGMIVRRNLLPISVAPSYSVAIHERIRDISLLDQIPCDVGMIPHDMGLHAAAIHAIPSAAWDELVALAFARVRSRPARILLGPFGVLARVAEFFEGPLTTHGWQAWQDADEPEDFERCFEPHFRVLLDELRQI